MARRIVTVFEILILTTLFVFFTAFVITTNQNTAIIESTENFVELVRYKGCLTEEMYTNFLNEFNTPVSVEIFVEKQSSTNADDPVEYEFTKEILQDIQRDKPNDIYRMKTGDVIQIIVRKPSATLYDTVVGKLTGSYGHGSNPVVTQKGGMILNEQYDGTEDAP